MLVMPVAFILVSLKILIEVVFALNGVDFLLMTFFPPPVYHLNSLDTLKTRSWVH